ncbi:DUF4376 domain-containing protein [Rhodobacter capsulatus]|uniref:DUF4376 domain-containing protein n=1 Tax=Rhodobacter capsulatus TaxID=1061 RepID=UPI0006DD1F84|nr:DUF4376 domain-containing protein [Rhodobacter capsulatus]KQB15145.1 hypothetical protein AP071_14845 [Rhodobacter capsulatus]KQB16864.1 hypothetical protein AP073_09560 [Rhodobacter capsulatus]PZX23651.1 uncharacterized protein DUF4376 [Rhodobacter capsulatus]QNR62395.1 DUF4376 domain-containing protein [Rhodobacter capsulatus]
MEHGFFHPAHGYWQTIGTPEAALRTAYPEGTAEVPLRPGADHLWTGEGWEPAPARLSVDQALANLKAARDAAIARGIEHDGLRLQTDDLSQSRLTAAALAAQLDPALTLRWKLATGEFVALSAPQIIALALAVRAHVQACFDREADLAAQIRAAADPAAVALTF